MKNDPDYDVIVIGAGIAGMVSAVTANALGKRVAVVERSKLGGHCTNTTCIPSKALIRLSHICQGMAGLRRSGLLSSAPDALIGPMIMPHIRNIVRTAYEKDLPETFERIGIHILFGTASFIDGRHIRVDGQTLSARKFIIAAGTAPLIPSIEGIEDTGHLTNETLYQLDDLPRSLIILGGGVDGLEYASAFGRLGVKTTLIETAPRLLPQADEEVVHHLLEALRSDGIELLTGTKAVRASRREGAITLEVERQDGTCDEIRADQLLVAVGRKPELEKLELKKAGVRYDARGILVDRRLRTSAPHIYACGDIAGPYQLASTAEAQGIVAATNAVLPVKRSVDDRNDVSVIFTEPPLAFMGLTEVQAGERYGPHLKIYRFDYATMRRSIIDGQPVGMAKFLCDGRGRIIGAHILGEAAGEVIHEVQVIKALKKPLHRIHALTHAYPTYAQALVGRASQLAFLDRTGHNILVRIALSLLPGYANRLHLARERLAEFQTAPSDLRPVSRELILDLDARPLSEMEASNEKAADGGCRIQSGRSDEKIRVLHLRGTLDSTCEMDFAKAFRESVEKHTRILMDFSALFHMDTQGAGMLMRYASLAAQKNIYLAAFGLCDALRNVFRLTRLDQAIPLYDDERGATEGASFRRSIPSLHEDASEYKGPVASGWARPMTRLSTRDIPAKAMNINVDGRQTTSPAGGFGRLWDKRYRLHLDEDRFDPKEIIVLWKEEFPRFWPLGNRFYPSGKAPIAPGTVAVLNLVLPGSLVLATGLMVLYADETSFSFITIEGHILAGWITFRSYRRDGSSIIEINPLFRASDPLMELGMRFGAAKQEDRFWHATLGNLAHRLGVRGKLTQQDALIDPDIRWAQFKNIRHSAAVRSLLYMPIYMARRFLSRRKDPEKGP